MRSYSGLCTNLWPTPRQKWKVCFHWQEEQPESISCSIPLPSMLIQLFILSISFVSLLFLIQLPTSFRASPNANKCFYPVPFFFCLLITKVLLVFILSHAKTWFLFYLCFHEWSLHRVTGIMLPSIICIRSSSKVLKTDHSLSSVLHSNSCQNFIASSSSFHLVTLSIQLFCEEPFKAQILVQIPWCIGVCMCVCHKKLSLQQE